MKYRFFTIVFLFCLYGCSGGISGTGDGGPVQPTDVETIASGDNTPDATGSESTDTFSRFAILPNQLILDLPGTLQADTTASTSSIDSPGTRLREGITAAQLDVIAIQIDLFVLDQYLYMTTIDDNSADSESDSTCVSVSDCELHGQQINTTVSADVEVFATSQPYSADLVTTSSFNTRANIRAGDSITYNNVSLQSGLTGFFDNRLQYNRSNGDLVILQWSSDQLWVSVQAQNADSTLYSLLQIDSSEMTMRRTDHGREDASIQFRAIQNTAAIATDATYVEADLSDNEPVFARAIGNASNSAIFSESLLSDGAQFREATNITGQLTDLESCMEPCTQWQPLLVSQTLPDTFFDTNRDIIDNVSRSIVNPVDVSILPDGVNEFVITIGDATGAASDPATQTDSLVCGGQRLTDDIRTFCWQPTPIGSRVFIFEESRVNGALIYRLFTQSDDF